ncbi:MULTISPECIES: GNAT family N-acetyltransferase [Niallia]|uniref:GNAT family N-acetyltransferase n=1 Tax=Niallia circulans TaxID=1397 RepID=A0A268FHE0_NIACI|nr:GNAT family N-acetyltransferase [Niallia circulans]AYV66485.1 N-acetyltransferase [Niallia circulans]AYV70697.1 N-acetyltransferase [Niallia circulans]NRG29741.1 GNAT family N-acetyltransferase [Niallia circulans]PAD84795.1 GNAT family N-acetyltransferase [Niallia circulans]QJX62375.1 GNAT family N-acetyltransferase [Niallia circulans]
MKSADQYLIRHAKLEDAEAIFAIQQSVIAEEDYLITTIEEFNQTLEDQQAWVAKILHHNERETILIAEETNKVIGFIVFQTKNRQRLNHTGSLGMMISKKHRSKGIGKLLIKALLAWAKENPLIEKVSLGVFSTNTRAISLYTCMGFIEEGRKIKEIKLSENEYIDDILMYKMVI